MRENISENYFAVFKLAGLVVLLGYHVIYGGSSLMEKAFLSILGAGFLMTALLVEWVQGSRRKWIILIAEGILTVLSVFLFPVTGSYFGLVCLLDGISVGKGEFSLYFLGYLWEIFFWKEGQFFLGLCVITFCVLIYVQEKLVLLKYRERAEKSQQTEEMLKYDMQKEQEYHQDELKKFRLDYENKMLEEWAEISQALHDKLGHSINGSLYQLEAAKLLIEKKPADCEKILQEVIHHLRLSMDEIRSILRKEKPDKKGMALISLQSLCKECEEKYHILTELNITGAIEDLADEIWEIILDNTFEAVTNALKYAECRHLWIEIAVLNQVVRCCIKNDGKSGVGYQEGMGIAGMRKRVCSVHGYFDIEAEMGFAIHMVLPLKREEGV